MYFRMRFRLSIYAYYGGCIVIHFIYFIPYRPSKTTTAEPEVIGTERHIIMQRGSSERHSVKILTEFEHLYNIRITLIFLIIIG